MNDPESAYGKVSLDAIAIGIFLMVLTVLLGPLLNISPLVPLGGILAWFGFGAIDRLLLGGTFTGLALDRLARFDRAYTERIIYHEAGHYLLAHLFEIPVTDYSLTAWDAWKKGQPGSGGVVLTPPPFVLDSRGIDRYCTIWMAGIAAERLVYGDSRGGFDDRQKLRGVLATFGVEANRRQEKENWALLQAKSQIEKHQSAFDGLVECLTQGLPVSECDRLLAERINPTDTV